MRLLGKPSLLVGLSIVFAILTWSTPARAGLIAEVLTPADDVMLWSFDANNENVSDPMLSDNFGTIDVRLTEHAPFDMVLAVTDSAGVSEYDLSGLAANNSPRHWAGMRMELGFLTGSAFTVAALDGLDFDTPDRDPGVAYSAGPLNLPPDTWTPTRLEWPDTLTLIGNAGAYRFHLDVPDADPTRIPAGALTSNGYDLTVRFTPLPEPASGAVLMLLGTGLLARRPARRRRLSGSQTT